MAAAGNSFLWNQLIYLAPWLIVCLVAAILALVNFRRSFVPSLFTLLGVSIMVTEMVSVAAIMNYLINRPTGPDFATFRWVSIAGNLIRAAGFLMVVIAIFLGRRPRLRRDSGAE